VGSCLSGGGKFARGSLGRSFGIGPTPLLWPGLVGAERVGVRDSGGTCGSLTFTASATATTGTTNITVTGTSGSIVQTATIALTVTTAGGGPQTAVYSSTLKAPVCSTVGFVLRFGSNPTLRQRHDVRPALKTQSTKHHQQLLR